MSKPRKTYSDDFKFKAVIDMIRNEMTIAEICAKYQVPKNLIYKWKKQFVENGSSIFSEVV